MPQCARCPAWAGDEKWRTLCRKCFSAQKKKEEKEKDRVLARLMHENQILRSANQQLRMVDRSLDGTIPMDKLKALIQLCHPDKHSGSRISTETTAWLLDQRKRHPK